MWWGVLYQIRNTVRIYLGDIAGSVPDHGNEASYTIFFGFPEHIKVIILYLSIMLH
jgi:hypothetical protein